MASPPSTSASSVGPRNVNGSAPRRRAQRRSRPTSPSPRRLDAAARRDQKCPTFHRICPLCEQTARCLLGQVLVAAGSTKLDRRNQAKRNDHSRRQRTIACVKHEGGSTCFRRTVERCCASLAWWLP